MNNDNIPKFPVPGPMEKVFINTGPAALRDYFAGQALAGDLASQSRDTGEWFSDASREALENRAAFFYRFADAMLAARENKI